MTNEQIRQNLASNLKHIRSELSFTQEQFSEYLGIKRGNLATMEESRAANLETLAHICDKLNISLDTLLLTEMKK